MNPTLPGLPDAIFESTLGLLVDLAAISSPSGDRAGLRRMAERLGEALAARSLAVEIVDETPADGTEPLPVLQARGTNIAAGHLLLLGHLDTVLPAATPTLRAEALYATGAIDMKGGLAILAGALDLLTRRGVAPAPDLLLVAVPDEEVGGSLSRDAVRRFGESARALWVLEPGEPGRDADSETLVAGRRGLFDWQVTVTGRPAHSGIHYWSGRSALVAAARFATAAEALSVHGGPTVNVARLTAGEAGFVDGLLARSPEALALLGSERQRNVVPDRALLEGEARVLRIAEADDLAAKLTALAAEIGAATGTELRLTRGALIPPVDPQGPQRAWCDRAIELAHARGWRLEIEEDRGGISFPNFLPHPGRIPVLDGLAPIGAGMHTRDEHVLLRSFGRRIVLLADLLEADAKSQRPMLSSGSEGSG